MTNQSDTFAVIGAGPAGASLARILADAGKDVLLFDPRAPWEKPCGGMFAPGAFEDHPELRSYTGSTTRCGGLRCESPRGDVIFVPADIPFPMVSRREMGAFLLEKARESGATFIPERVIGIVRERDGWRITTPADEYRAGMLIGADGAFSIVRRTVMEPIPRKHLSLTCGYYLEGVPPGDPVLKFLDVQGYLWIFPRALDASAGIGARIGTAKGSELFSKLDRYIAENYPGTRVIKKWSALLPGASDPGFFDESARGDGWMLLGDAAGFVDPVSGEGIQYALESARCAGESILAGDPALYDELWRERFGSALAEKARHVQHLETLAAQFGPEMYGAFLYNYFAAIAAK